MDVIETMARAYTTSILERVKVGLVTEADPVRIAALTAALSAARDAGYVLVPVEAEGMTATYVDEEQIARRS